MSKHQFIKGTFWVGASLIFSKFVSLIVRMIVARIGVTETGIFFLAMYILKLALILSILGFREYIVRDIAEAATRKDPGLIRNIIMYATAVLLPVSIVIALVLFLGSYYIGVWFHEMNLVLPLRIIAMILPFQVGLMIVNGFFRGTQNWKALIFFKNFGRDSLRLIATIIAFILLGTINAVLFSYLIIIIILAIMALFFIKKRLTKKKSKKKFDWKKPFTFTTPLLGAGLALGSLEWIDSFMIGRMLSVADVGIYDTAFSVAWVLLLLPYATMTFFLPKIIEIHEKKKNLQAYYKKITAWHLALNGFLAAIFILFGK